MRTVIVLSMISSDFSRPVLRYYRNAGDVHAAGAELQRSPQERQKKQDPTEYLPAGSDFQIKTGSRFAHENQDPV
jgi:hypothetical protein